MSCGSEVVLAFVGREGFDGFCQGVPKLFYGARRAFSQERFKLGKGHLDRIEFEETVAKPRKFRRTESMAGGREDRRLLLRSPLGRL